MSSSNCAQHCIVTVMNKVSVIKLLFSLSVIIQRVVMVRMVILPSLKGGREKQKERRKVEGREGKNKRWK